MAKPYSEAPSDEADQGPAIIGQVSGPRSWSEYCDPGGGEFDASEQFHRRNPTPLRDDAPTLSELREGR